VNEQRISPFFGLRGDDAKPGLVEAEHDEQIEPVARCRRTRATR
jgi:hypothetical protein